MEKIASFEKIAQILRAKPEKIKLLEEKLGVLTGKKEVLNKVSQENEAEIRRRLDFLGLGRNVSAKEVYDALISKIEADNDKLFKALGSPSVLNSNDWQRVLGITQKIAGAPKGLFLKKEKAVELLKSQPPVKILSVLNYKSVDEMLQKEDIFEIFSALRFVEGNDWLNKVFFKQYGNLKPDDFETREIKVLALPERWAKIAQNFIKRKYHNISHLKEMGIIYIIPLSLEVSGETMRNFILILHYFNEIKFYSGLFEKFRDQRAGFSENLISLLRGDIVSEPLEVLSGKINWLVVQRYLAKDDENDWRLFEPHVNPEAIHWSKAEKMLVCCGNMLGNSSLDLSFWENLDWIGDFFENGNGNKTLVSFNLIDMAMSLVKEKELVKYLYHHQEALWNKIFTEYFGEEKMDELIKENIIKGWFTV